MQEINANEFDKMVATLNIVYAIVKAHKLIFEAVVPSMLFPRLVV